MIFIALLLLAEGFSTGFGFYQLAPSLRYLGWAVIILAVLRAVTGIMQWVGGMSLLMRRYQFARLSQIALVASAILTTFEIGLRVMPNNLDPTWRWPLTALYWIYAMGASYFLGHVRVDKNTEVREYKSLEVREYKSLEVRERKTSEVGEEKGTEAKSMEAKNIEAKNSDPGVTTPQGGDHRRHDGDDDGRDGPASID